MSGARSFATDDGTRLNIVSVGEGIPVVFLHGLCGDAGQTSEVFPAMSGYNHVTVEARGHGSSQPGSLDRLSIATFAGDIERYIEKHLEAPVVIGGISMGAAISLRLAVMRPDLVRALIVARPAWLTAAAPENMAPNAEVGRLLGKLPPELAKTQFLAGSIGQRLAELAPDNLASLTGFFDRRPIDVTAALLTAIANDGPGITAEDVARIGVPTLVIGHGQDVIHPVEYAQAIAAAIPRARLVEITPKSVSRAGYVADFRRALADFLQEI